MNMHSTFRATLGVVAMTMLSSMAVQAQNTFQKLYHTHPWDFLAPAINVTSGVPGVDYYLQTSQSYDPVNLFSNVVLNKVDQNGNLLWTREWSGNTYNHGTKLTEAENEDYIISGYSNTLATNSEDLLVARILSNGGTFWCNSYTGTGMQRSFGVVEDAPSGDIYVGGYANGNTAPPTFGTDDFNLTKLDGNGNFQWSREYGGNSTDRGANVCMGYNQNEVLISGNTWSYGAGARDVAVIAANTINGGVLWAFAYGNVGLEEAYIKPVLGNDYLLVGWTTGNSAIGDDILAMKIDQNGALLWARTYPGPADERAYDFTEVSDGYVLSGHTTDGPHGLKDILGVKIDIDGNLQWSQAYGGELDDDCYSISNTPVDDGLLFGAETSSFHFQDASKYLIKAGPNGVTCNCNNLDYPLGMNDPGFVMTQFTPAVEMVTYSSVGVTPTTPTTEERALCRGDFSGATARPANPGPVLDASGHIKSGPGGGTDAPSTDASNGLLTPAGANQGPSIQVDVRNTSVPSQYQVFATGAEDLTDLEMTVIDSRGQVIQQGRINANGAVVDLLDHAPGLYIITLKSEGHVVHSAKVIHAQR